MDSSLLHLLYELIFGIIFAKLPQSDFKAIYN
ncbi:MAG: hypothetical protein PWP35_554 [Bacteroidales bacterium]|jgi:hypothetical protein|nr:hypothetical protein [Bacteroidales bacterium]